MNEIDRLIRHWQISLESRTEHLTRGLVTDWIMYKAVVAERNMCLEILEQLQKVAGGFEEDDKGS